MGSTQTSCGSLQPSPVSVAGFKGRGAREGERWSVANGRMEGV